MTGPGEIAEISVGVTNVGPAVTAVKLEVYLSRDSTMDDEDVVLTSTRTDLPSDELERISALWATIPRETEPGRYHVIAFIDPDDSIPESDESNNIASSSESSLISTADVVVASVEGNDHAFPDEPYRFEVELRNEGHARARTFYVSLHFSDNMVINTFDPLLTTVGPLDLAVGGRITLRGTALPPSDLQRGTYSLGVIADSTSSVDEENEANNIARRQRLVTFRDAAPDLAIDRLAAGPIAAAGEPLMVERSLVNRGNAPAAFEYRLILSRGGEPSLLEDRVLSARRTTLAHAAQDARAEAVLIPSDTPLGVYYVGCVIDPSREVEELDETNNATMSPVPITVLRGDLTLVNDRLPFAVLGLAYTADLSALGGLGAYHWTVTGELPPGLGLEQDSGRLFGTPTELGTFDFVVTVDDGTREARKPMSILVTSPTTSIEVVTRALPPAFVGRPYQAVLTSKGGVGRVAWSTGASLPEGLDLDPRGRMGGTPRAIETRTIVLRATDEVGQFHERALMLRSIQSESSVRFRGVQPSDGRRGRPFFFEFQPEPGTGVAPYRFGLASGQIPPGLRLDGAVLSGVPSAVGEFNFDLRLEDDRRDFDLDRFFITIREDRGLTIVEEDLTQGTVGLAYGPVRLRAVTDADADAEVSTIRFSLADGALPTGLVLSDDGTISGTPVASGVTAFLVRASDGARQSDTAAFVIVVSSEEPLAPVDEGPESSCGCSTSRRRVPNPSTSEGLSIGWLILAMVLAGRVKRTETTRMRALVPILTCSFSLSFSSLSASSASASPSASASLTLDTATSESAFSSESASQSASPSPAATTTTSSSASASAGSRGRGLLFGTPSCDAPLLRVLEGQMADLVVDSVGHAASRTSPGAIVGVEARVANRGFVECEARLTWVMSRNAFATAMDVVVGISEITLPSGSTSTVTASVRIPEHASAGTWHLGAIADVANEIEEMSELNNSIVSRTPILVIDEHLAIAGPEPPPAFVSLPYTTFLHAEGGDGDYRFDLVRGALPNGLHLVSTSGEIRGTPTRVDRATFDVRVTSGGQSVISTLGIAVDDPQYDLVILTRDLEPGIVGAEYPLPDLPDLPDDVEISRRRIEVVGGSGIGIGQITLAAISGLPPGLVLDSDGYLHGTPTQAGEFAVAVRATDGASVAKSDLPITIAEPGRLTIVAGSLPGGTYEEPYRHRFRVLGGLGVPARFASNGALPRGLSITEDGLLVGTALEVGTFMFEVEARQIVPDDVLGRGELRAFDACNFQIAVAPLGALRIMPASLAAAEVDVSYRAKLILEDGAWPIVWEVKGAPLPTGLGYQVDDEGGLEFYGIAEEEGVVALEIVASDSSSRRAHQAYALEARQGPSDPAPELRGCSCRSADSTADSTADSSADRTREVPSPWGLAVLGLIVFLRQSRMAPRMRAPKFLSGVAPWLIAILLVGCDETSVTTVVPALRVEPARLDFGSTEIGQPIVLFATLRSLAPVAVTIRSVETDDDCGGCFRALSSPSAVGANSEIELPIQFRPNDPGTATGTVTIESDDPSRPLLGVSLSGEGSDARRPNVEVSPLEIDFGIVPAGGIALASFVIRSTGTNDLLVDRIAVEPPSAPFRITTSTPTPSRPGRLAPGREASVTVRAALPHDVTSSPPSTSTSTSTSTSAPRYSGRVLVETNATEIENVPGRRGVVAVALTATPNRPPVAVAGEDQRVAPWSRVTLDGSASYDQDSPPDLPLVFRWDLVERPPGSTAVLERASTAAPAFWADLTGSYALALTVIDARGVESEPDLVTIRAVPLNVIRIELTWDHPEADLDLHLIRESGAFCECATDVHYRDCARSPNWFPEAQGANPRLDVDDRGGLGPENINLDGDGPSRFIPPETFRIAVHYFATNEAISDWPTSTAVATVRVYVFGLLRGEFSRSLSDAGEVWVPASISWPSEAITTDDTFVTGVRCGVL